MKKIGFSTVLALALVASLLGAPGSAAPKQIEGSFTAQANPLPHAWFDPARPCGGRQTRDPASYVDHELTAPFSGWFAARMSFEQGDWDLSILGSDLEPLAMSDHQEATGEESERLRLYLKRGQKVVLRACNFASTVSAEVVWSLVKGRGWAPVRAKAAGRIEEHSYISPAAAVGEAFVICHAYFDAGCTAFKPHSSDRSVAVRIEDKSGLPVSFKLYQYAGNTAFAGQRFCGSTPDAVPLQPGVDWVGVTVFNGPCDDETVTAPTQGKVTFTLYNRLPGL
jgi:hypothetical protein